MATAEQAAYQDQELEKILPTLRVANGGRSYGPPLSRYARIVEN
jgi:hypothetical protein